MSLKVTLAVGIVIATRNRREDLLRALARQTGEPHQVVVVDNASTDGTAEAVRAAHPGVRLITLDDNRGAAARTAGAQALDTPVVAFSDDDSWWAPGALERIGELFDEHPSLGLVSARILVGDDERLDPTCEAMARSPLPQREGLPGARVLGFVACGAAVRRSAFLSVGGFHPRMGVGGEETLLAVDLASRGWDLAYIHDLVAHHHPRPDHARSRREAVMLRNRLWAAWLRRPAGGALAETARALVAASPSATVRAVPDAVRGMGWIARDRRVVPPSVERDLALLAAG